VPVSDAVVHGKCDPSFAAVKDAFAANFAADLEVGASLCVEVDGRSVVDVWGGWLDTDHERAWERDSITCVFSCTKGLAAIALLRLVDRGAVDLDAAVSRYWPEFAAAGKDTLPVRYLLTHEGGLSAIGKPMPFGSLSDWDAMVTALAEQAPWWQPGTGHGYHGVTFGHLVGEVVRRVDGRTIAPSSRSRLFTVSSFSPATTPSLSRSMIGLSVSMRTNTPAVVPQAPLERLGVGLIGLDAGSEGDAVAESGEPVGPGRRVGVPAHLEPVGALGSAAGLQPRIGAARVGEVAQPECHRCSVELSLVRDVKHVLKLAIDIVW
jgi:CubicO group peptidase (beta-lactamase class C family)